MFENAYLGSLVADAVSVPVHWYYDREALRAEYGEITGYLVPKNPHSGSILWRSQYTAPNEKGEILHDQARYWGQRGIHYHQFLKAGENTLNYQLANELVRLCEITGGYDPDAGILANAIVGGDNCHRGAVIRLPFSRTVRRPVPGASANI